MKKHVIDFDTDELVYMREAIRMGLTKDFEIQYGTRGVEVINELIHRLDSIGPKATRN